MPADELDTFTRFCRDVLTTENGKPLLVEGFQERILAGYFAGTRETVVIVGKKNGKSSLLAALALHHLLVEPFADVIIVAASRDQAGILLRQVVGYITRSEALRGRLRVVQREVRYETSGGRIRVLASDSARQWRQDAYAALRAGTLTADRGPTLGEAADAWLEAARAGIVRNRSAEVYKPAALRSYDRVLRLHVLPVLGRERLRELTLPELQRFVDRLAGDGLAAATITTTITPLRAIYRRARQLGDVQNNPTSGLSVPAVNRRQTKFATAPQIEAMLSKLDSAKDRAMWATALYGGLRRGELMGLHREAVDLATGVIRVERGWDDCEGEVAPKSKQGRRKVPIPAALRDRLAEYLIDGPTAGRIFVGARDSYDRGRAAAEAAKVEPPTLHECRHGYATLMIAAGVNVKALSNFMGHANIRITLDQYGHLLPGAEDEAAALLDAFLARQVGSDDPEPSTATALRLR